MHYFSFNQCIDLATLLPAATFPPTTEPPPTLPAPTTMPPVDMRGKERQMSIKMYTKCLINTCVAQTRISMGLVCPGSGLREGLM